MKTGIYMIRNKINDKKYIGQAVDIDKRWGEHIKELNNNQKYCNPHLQNAWNKYGADNFEFTIICLCEEEELNDFEIDMISRFDTYNNGYNLTLGGDGTKGYRFTDEQRAKMREVMNRPEVKAKVSERTKEAFNRPEVRKKHRERTKEALNKPEVKVKISERTKEAMNSLEVKTKLSEAMKEYYKDPENRKKKSEDTKEAMNRPEVRAKISQAMKEESKRRWSDPEYKAKISESLKEVLNRPEVKAKMIEAQKEAFNRPEVRKKKSESMKGKNAKAVYCVTNDTIYKSCKEAEEKLNIPGGTVSYACRGKYGPSNGHVYKKLGLEFWFLDEYEENNDNMNNYHHY